LEKPERKVQPLARSKREERERDRHIDLSNAPFVAGSNLLDTGQGASNNLIKPDATSLARVSTRMGRES
jgi:hypothetical protein